MSSKELPFKTIKLLLLDLENQGCRTKEVKMGWMVFFPNGESATIHRTPSDIRTIKNLRSYVLRSGCTWMLDPKKKTA